MGFSSGYYLVGAMLGWNFLTLLLTFVLTSYQAVTTESLPTIRRSDTNLIPDLVLGENFTYHLFLSHMHAAARSPHIPFASEEPYRAWLVLQME